ncbi:MAG: ABC transporter permease [Phycisphaerae bacterium]|nr:ABC transporter permease [Phycisphaerae bacterium]
MITQTLALLLDTYREFNSKRLFWISLAISGLIVAGLAALGVTKTGVTVLVWEIDLPFMDVMDLTPERFYKLLFTRFGVGFWLSWLGAILALVSTAGMIPDFIASGAVELTLSKPVSRTRLFLTKYACGLLFVALQVSVFTVASFLVIGIRGGVWEPGLFLAVPLVVVFFSYLFAICVLLGLLTRSTIASLLLTLLCWLFFFCLNAADVIVIQGREMNLIRQEMTAARIERMEKSTAEVIRRGREEPGEPDAPPTAEEIDRANPRLPEARATLERARTQQPRWETASRVIVTVKTAFPKTSETIQLIDRWVIEAAKLEKLPGEEPDAGAFQFGSPMSPQEQRQLQSRIDDRLRGRTVWWVLGTSLGFEALVLGLACLVFVRRDF